ncbi:hypothetical protein ACH6EH_19875 [Paenibacillus sp. JSM ZJ436]|uniref:hypothetical protein n=1 Tax=Paenibacillus sp. JSM ZJ436 TaxID=3376190 RepID=UPI0037BC4322
MNKSANKRVKTLVALFMLSTALTGNVFASGETSTESSTNAITDKHEKIKSELLKDDRLELIEDHGDGNFSVALKPNVSLEQMSEVMKRKDVLETENEVMLPQWTNNYTLYDIRSGESPGGSTYFVEFNSNVSVTGGDITSDEEAIWSGWHEDNLYSSTTASSITSSDNFSYTYIGWNPTFSVPSGISFTGGGSSITVNYPEKKGNWYMHYYNNIIGRQNNITSVAQSASVTFLAGGKSFSISSYDSADN